LILVNDSAFHASSIVLVLNSQTLRIYPQYHAF
jgi:hypothetical protein